MKQFNTNFFFFSFLHSNYGIITLESDSNVFFDDIIKSTKTKYVDLDKQVEGSVFRFNFVSKLNIRCDKVNEPKGSSYIKSTDWLRYRNATINPKTTEDRCSQFFLLFVFLLTQKSKIIASEYKILNQIKSVFDLYNLKSTEYPTVMYKNDCS